MTQSELLKIYFKNRHILQSPEWGQFKTLMGTKAVTVDGAQMTIHKLPLGISSVGYCPKVRPEDLDLEKIYEAGKKNNCLFVKLDVPHAPEGFKVSAEGGSASGGQSLKFKVEAGKSVFAQSTILMDLTKSDAELLEAMHEKTRYNIGLSQRKGVTVKIFSNSQLPESQEALNQFIRLQKETARRQKFFVHPDHYYRTAFEILSAHNMAYLLEAKLSTFPAVAGSRLGGGNSQLSTPITAASWLLFRYDDVLYYPYGESNYEYRAYMPSNLLMWAAIQLGKEIGCKIFDLWGAASNPTDESDPWYGFTRFKLSFGGLHVRLAPTYDLVINDLFYKVFNTVNDLRWKLLKIKR